MCFSNENERLPRYSSKDFYEIDLGDPTHDIVLNAGDVLYIPRGCIHQACTQDDEHSLHITISAYQRNAWIDLLEEVGTLIDFCIAQDRVILISIFSIFVGFNAGERRRVEK